MFEGNIQMNYKKMLTRYQMHDKAKARCGFPSFWFFEIWGWDLAEFTVKISKINAV